MDQPISAQWGKWIGVFAISCNGFLDDTSRCAEMFLKQLR